MIFIISDFNIKLAELINNSNLPLDVVTLCLQNNMYQIEIIKLSSKIDELSQLINDDLSNEDNLSNANSTNKDDLPINPEIE